MRTSNKVRRLFDKDLPRLLTWKTLELCRQLGQNTGPPPGQFTQYLALNHQKKRNAGSINLFPGIGLVDRCPTLTCVVCRLIEALGEEGS